MLDKVGQKHGKTDSGRKAADSADKKAPGKAASQYSAERCNCHRSFQSQVEHAGTAGDERSHRGKENRRRSSENGKPKIKIC